MTAIAVGGRTHLLATNAVANLIRGISSSLLNLVLPLALIRVFSVDEYAVWVLIFSVSLYTVYLDLGLVSSMSTLVARAAADGDLVLARRYVASGLRLMSVVSALILFGYVCIALGFRALFPGVPASLASSATNSLIILAGAQVVVLFSNVITGYFVGLQDSRVPATAISIGKVVVFIATLAAALSGVGLTVTAMAYFTATTAYFVVLVVVYVRAPRSGGSASDRRPAIRSVLAVSGILGAFSLSMLIVSGLDTAIVARFDFRDLAAFGVASSLGSLVIGLFGAVLSPLLPEFTRMVAHGRQERMVQVVVRTTALLTQALGVVFLAATMILPVLLPVLAGGRLARTSLGLSLLVIYGAIRLTSTPISAGVVALGQKRTILLIPAFSEAIVNLSISLSLCRAVGAAGVALGTIAGACTSIATMVLIVVPQSTYLRARRAELLLEGWIIPLARLAPALLAAAVYYYSTGPAWIVLIIVLSGFISSTVLIGRPLRSLFFHRGGESLSSVLSTSMSGG